MKITVITVTMTADSAYAITRASVEAQSHADIEHVVVCAHGPLPDSPAESVLLPPKGVYNAINAGLARASGDVVGLLHGGDTFAAPDILAAVAEKFATHPDIDYLYGDIRYIDADGHTATRQHRGCPVTRSLLIRGIYPPHPTLYMRTQAAREIGPYSERYRICGDFDMWVRLHNAGMKGLYMPRLMVEMSLGGLSTRLGSRLWTNNIEKLQVLHAHGLPANPLRLGMKYLSIAHDIILKKNGTRR